MKALHITCIVLLVSFGGSVPAAVQSKKNAETVGGESDLRMILVSTLDGRLRALDMDTGKEMWEMQEDPVIRAPSTVTQGFTYLPNPQDGSLYSLKEGVLRKLPFSIPQLVAASPIVGNDGVYYDGTKKDVWIGIDPITGDKTEVLSSTTQSHKVCPANDVDTVFIGRREYRVTMRDIKNRSKVWNTTFVDYSTHLQPEDSSYPLRHLVSSSSGDVLAIHEKTGSLLWQTDVGQPVAAMYLLRSNGLHKLGYTPVGRETMEGIVEKSFLDESVLSAALSPSAKTGFYPALYVGESIHGLFASNAYVDEKTRTFAPRYLGPNLIDGPTPIALPPSDRPPRREAVDIDVNTIIHKTEDGEFLVLGYHVPPQLNLAAILPTQNINPHFGGGPSHPPFIEYVKHKEDNPKVIGPPLRTIDDETVLALLHTLYTRHPTLVTSVVIGVITLLVATIWMCGRQMGVAEAMTAQTSQNSRSRASMGGRGDGEGEEGEVVLPSGKRSRGRIQTGWMNVGKVDYNASDVLGTGCQGTVVYRGKFDGREVAVKRVLTEFLPLVDREVELLRESDNHPNVIRYFCMEADSQFRYLALELCVASLYDYIEKKKTLRGILDITSEEILRQSTAGLAHLHSINIVHRDLKPQNVLISTRGKGRATALISDFGLCKRLHPGRFSLSKRSGVAGTDGWIAPEALSGQSTSYPMDIFSLGCLFYYVLTDGSHPFGEALHRTSNILNGVHSLDKLSTEDDRLSSHLITQSLSRSPTRRPIASAILIHPFFWGTERQLAFFGDVSDRVEKEVDMSPILRRLEKNGFAVVKKNWRDRICDDLREDLRKFRTYKAGSVRDLLRAMRNKKHHYRELPENVRISLGEVPHEFVVYFTSRFPDLLLHVYEAMEWCSDEAIFTHYYSDEVRIRMKEIREETEKRQAEDNSDSETWTRGRVSVSSPDGVASTSSPLAERRRLELLPRSKPQAISESSEASEVQSTMEDVTPTEKEEEEEGDDEPTTLVPRSELIASTTVETTVVNTVMMGPPPGLEDVIPTPLEERQTPTGNNKKKKNKKKN